MATSLSHLFILVSDLAAQRLLFVDLLGLNVLDEQGGYLRVGGGDGFHIGCEEGDPGSVSAIEIVIRVDDVDTTYERLAEAGVAVEGPPQDQYWGARHAWFRDGDGRRMSIYT